MNFSANGNYIMSVGTSVRTITLSSGANINVAAGMSAEANIPLAGTGGFTKSGLGSFGFHGAVPSGTINVTEGTLFMAGPNGDLQNATAVNISSGAVLDFIRYNDGFC